MKKKVIVRSILGMAILMLIGVWTILVKIFFGFLAKGESWSALGVLLGIGALSFGCHILASGLRGQRLGKP